MNIKPIATIIGRGTNKILKTVGANVASELKVAAGQSATIDTVLRTGIRELKTTQNIGFFKAFYLKGKAYLKGFFVEIPRVIFGKLAQFGRYLKTFLPGSAKAAEAAQETAKAGVNTTA